MKIMGFLKRHAFLLLVYALLVLEAIYHMFRTNAGIWSLRSELFLGIGIFVVYYLVANNDQRRSKDSEFRALADHIYCGIATIRMDDGFTLQHANPAFFQIIGYTEEEFQEKYHDQTIHLVQKEDLPLVLLSVGKLTVDEAHGHFNFRVICRSGQTKWVHMDTFLFHADGRHPVFQCIFTDITKIKSAVEQAEMETERFQIICKLSNDILLDYDVESGCMTTSQPISDLFGEQTVIPHFYQSVEENHIVHPDDLPALSDFLAVNEQDKIEAELRIFINVRYVWFRLEGLVVQSKSQKPWKIIGKFNNIDHIKRENEHLQKKLQQDPMTGIYNKVVTEQLVDRYLQEAEDDDVSALFILDLDDFKHINDSFGHLSGDKILTYMTNEMKSVLRSSDIFGRIGGDEFIVFVKNIRTRELASTKARKLCQAFHKISIMDGLPCNVSGSVGIAMFPEDGQSYHELFSKADRALYTAKEQGKDGFAFYGEDGSDHSYVLEKGKPPHTPLSFSGQHIVDRMLNFFNEHCMDKNATEKMLSIICRSYKAKRGCLLEFSASGETIAQIYSWYEPGYAVDTTKLQEQPAIYWKEYLTHFDQDAVFQCNSIQKLGAFLKDAPNLSSLQHIAFYQQRPSSILILDHDFSQSPLTLYELEILKLVHSLLQYHLLLLQNLRVSQELLNVDTLTGVHTNESFRAVLNQTLSMNPDKRYALISCDINRFSEINELIGHNQADQILVALASVVRELLQPGEYIGRVSADIFCILAFFETEEILHARMQLFERLFNERVKSYHLVDRVQIVGGVYPIHAKTDTPATIFDRANAARKLGKQAREKKIQFYDSSMHEKIQFEKELESYKYSSLQNQEFVIYLQPQYDLTNRKIAGAEALVRWNHPKLGMISPGAFIPLFEQDHFIIDLDFYVTEKVCRMLRRAIDQGQPVVPIAVNFSRVHLLTDDFVPKLLQIVDQYQIPPSFLELELTESAYISRMFSVAKISQELRGHGFLMAMDDFGEGYSSLNSLKNLQFDILKLDKNFFQEKEPTPKETIIVENLVRLAKQLNLCVVCEGVEFEWQAEFLCSIDCDLAQGFLFSHPVPAKIFEKMLLEDAKPMLHRPPL